MATMLAANPVIPVTAIALGLFILGSFIWVKISSDPFVLIVAAAAPTQMR